MTDSALSDRSQFYSVAELAREFSLTSQGIRFYEESGLIAPARVSLYKADATGAAQYRRGLERISERIQELESKRRDLDETLGGLHALELEAKERLERALDDETKRRRNKNGT